MATVNLRELQADPVKFRNALLIDCDGVPKRLGDMLDPWQDLDFHVLDGGWEEIVGQDCEGYKRAWLERPRGHSKTSDLAVMVCYALFASRRKLTGYAAAGDLDQAALLRNAIDGIVRLNPWLAQILTVDKGRVYNDRTGSTLEILTSDAPTSYGLTPDFVIADEVTHWRKRDLWDSLISSAAKRAKCMFVTITNAGFQGEWQWETREAIRQSENWYFSRLDGPKASWITEDRLEEQKRLLPYIAYARLWLNEWSSGSGDALDPSDIDRAVVLPGPQGPEPGYIYIAGLDLGLKKDASALVTLGLSIGYSEDVPRPERQLSSTAEAMINAGLLPFPPEDEPEAIWHPGTGRTKVVRVDLWKPKQGQKLNIEPIERAILDIQRQYNLAALGYDPWQSEYLAERLKKTNVQVRPVQFVPGNLQSMAQATIESFSERTLDLYAHPELLSDLKALRVAEKGYGVRLESPRGPSGHGDSATALAIALHVAKTLTVFTNRPPEGKLLIA